MTGSGRCPNCGQPVGGSRCPNCGQTIEGGSKTGDQDPPEIPAPPEDDLKGTLERVAAEGQAQCSLCDHIVQGDSYGEVFEKLAEHGEEAHNWCGGEGWEPGTEDVR